MRRIIPPLLAPSRSAVPGSVRGSVRPLRPQMFAASTEVLDRKIPFLCTQREYFEVTAMGGGHNSQLALTQPAHRVSDRATKI